MTQMAKLIGTAWVAAILAALAGILVSGGLSPALAQANTPATGAPVIEGAVQLDETLLARPWGHISDQDGMTNAVFQYQWQLHHCRRRRGQDHQGAGVFH